jgi:hypothetical protein
MSDQLNHATQSIEPQSVLPSTEKKRAHWTSNSNCEEGFDVEVSEAEVATEPPNRARRSRARTLYRVWRWEVISCLLSICSFIAIVAILASRDGQPIPHWPRLVTVNSLISSFTVVFKAALLLPVAEGKRDRNPSFSSPVLLIQIRLGSIEVVTACETATQLG